MVQFINYIWGWKKKKNWRHNAKIGCISDLFPHNRPRSDWQMNLAVHIIIQKQIWALSALSKSTKSTNAKQNFIDSHLNILMF